MDKNRMAHEFESEPFSCAEALNELSAIVDAELQLDPDPINEKWILNGNPCAQSKTLATSPDGASRAILWCCTAGSFYWSYGFHESALILSGEAYVHEDNGKRHRFSVGDFVFFPAGTAATWKIDDHVRKIAFIQEPMWRFAVPAITFCNKLTRKLGLAQNTAWKHIRCHSGGSIRDCSE